MRPRASVKRIGEFLPGTAFCLRILLIRIQFHMNLEHFDWAVGTED